MNYRASTFAHLLGLGKNSAKAVKADDEDKKPDVDAEEQDTDQDEDEVDKKEDEAKKAKASKKAEDPDDKDEDPDAEDEEEEVDAEEDEKKEDSNAKKARKAERTRCAAIFKAAAAANRPDMAAHFAFETNLSAKAAIAALTVAAAPFASLAPKKPSLAVRMAEQANPVVGAGDTDPNRELTPAQRLAAAAGKRTR
jgi:hypothetical protein